MNNLQLKFSELKNMRTKRSYNRVIAALIPWMATAQTTKRKHYALPGAVFPHGVPRIFGTTRMKAAIAPQKRTDGDTISAQKAKKKTPR